MQTNNKYYQLNIHLYEEESERENAPQAEEILDILAIEVQNTESTVETAIVVSKEKKENRQIPIKHMLQSLFYAVQWPQLKRQMTKEALGVMAKRHWRKATLGAFSLLLLFNIDLGSENTSQASLNSYREQGVVSASVVDAMPQDILVVSENAKANYIARFSGVAKGEMNKFGIPASIILSMAILYSNYGSSDLAQGGHNHFNITCAENHLAEGIVGRNIHGKECYVHYQNAWTSFRANSLKLNAQHYKVLKAIAGKDYSIWMAKLQKINYPQIEELLAIIKQHELYEFDKKQ